MLQKLVRQFLRTWKHHATMQVATLTVLAGSYTVVTLFLLVHQNLEKVLTQWGEEVEMSVYLKDEVTTHQMSDVQKILKEADLFESIEVVTKEKAAQRFKEQMAGYVPDLLTDSEFGNPLPQSIETKLIGGLSTDRQYDNLVSIAEKIENVGGVDEVSYGQGWVENYASVVEGFSLTSFMLIFVLLTGSLFVVGNSIRNSVSQRREEIEIMELVGATKNLVRMPFIFEGAVMGLLAGSLALLFCYFIFSWQTALISSNISFWSFTTQLESLNVWRSLALVFMSGAFGAFGSYLCVSKICNGWAAAQAVESWNNK